MPVQMKRRPYFREVIAEAGSDRTAWEEALDLWALAMARCLSLDRSEPGSESRSEPQEGGPR